MVDASEADFSWGVGADAAAWADPSGTGGAGPFGAPAIGVIPF